MKSIIALIIFLIPPALHAQEKTWAHSSELGITLAGGNSDSENYSFKQQTTLNLPPNLFRVSANYLNTKNQGTDSALKWSLGIRYERELTERLSAFLNHLVESDIFSGMIQRNSYDIGLKIFFLKSQSDQLFSEVGYRNAFEQRVISSEGGTTHYGRIYAEWSHNWEEKISHTLWVEYLPNFTQNEAYLINGEPSVSIHFSSIISVKLAYNIAYRNLPAAGKKRTDTLYSTVLTATF